MRIHQQRGTLLCDKAAVQILGGGAVAIGCQEPSLVTAKARESLTFYLSDIETITTPSMHSTSKKSTPGCDHFINETDFLEHEHKLIKIGGKEV